MSKPVKNAALSILTAAAVLAMTGGAFAAEPKKPTASPETLKPATEVPPATIDSDGDGKADAWDRDANGKADAWDKNADGKPDAFDNDGDGAPDPA